MIKNGGRLLRARRRAAAAAAESNGTSTRCAYQHRHPRQEQPALLPPAFLLPAWTGVPPLEEKIAAAAARSSSSTLARRHASSYAHAELTRNHEVYTPEWLSNDVSEASPTPSTSKAIPPLESTKSSRNQSGTSKGAISAGTTPVTAQSADRQSAPMKLPSTSPALPHATDKCLTEAIEDAQMYLQHPKALPTSSDPFSLLENSYQIDLPVAVLPLELQRALIHPTLSTCSHSEIPLTASEISLATEQLNTRYNLACRILAAALRRSRGQSPITPAEAASSLKTFQDLVFLEAKSTSAILHSLSFIVAPSIESDKRLPRLVTHALLAYMYRDVRQQTAQVTSPSQIEQSFLIKHITRFTRRLRSLPSSHLPSFVLPHLDLFKYLAQSLELENPSTPSAVFRLLQCIPDLNSADGHSLQVERNVSTLLEMLAIPLKHVSSPSRRRTSLKDSIFLQRLEDSLLQSWHHNILPTLDLEASQSLVLEDVLDSIRSLQQLALQAKFSRLAARILLDVLGSDRWARTSCKGISNFHLGTWSSVITLCLRSGHHEQAEALLQALDARLGQQTSENESSMYWHLRLRAVLKADTSDPSLFFAKLDKLLKYIQQTDYRPDHHFLSTLLRYIPRFPASLDKACDLFQAAFALAHPQIVNNDLNTSTHNVASQLRLAAGHGDLALFERGQLEAVQLPWTPTLARSSTYGADLRLPDVQLERGTLSSQQVRYALLRGAISDAVSNFEQLTECLESVEALHAAIEPGRSEFAQVASDKMQTMWAGSFVRLLSATLQQQDLRTSTYVVEVALEGLGSKYVGQQAVKRLFIAACSPKFYDQPQMPPRRSVAPVILHQPFVRVMRIIRSWAEDVRLQDRNMMQSVADADMTSKQRLRSVLSRGNSSLAFARAMAMCLVPALFANGFGDTWFIQHQSFQNVDPTEVMQEALATMLALHVNCNLVRWWQQVERETEAQMDVWRISMHEVTRFKEQSRIMAMMCNRAEAERVAKVQQHRA